jgi:hypothetical protein
MGAFVAVRGTSSDAPAPASERDVRPAWRGVEDLPEERVEADAKGNAPQQCADPFATPRIPQSVGPRGDAQTPSSPPRARQVPQQEHAAYSLLVPSRQLTKHDLKTYRTGSLATIEAIANSVPYNGNVAYRNDLILDHELRTSNILTQFFIDGGVAELQPGCNLRHDGQGWKAVSNQVFFNAIRVAWNNFGQPLVSDKGGSSSAQPTVRNADVVWLEGWRPYPFLDPEMRMEMTFYHAECWDIRARARELQQFRRWQEEGAVIERWVENCA